MLIFELYKRNICKNLLTLNIQRRYYAVRISKIVFIVPFTRFSQSSDYVPYEFAFVVKIGNIVKKKFALIR